MATTAIQGAGWNGLGHVAAEGRLGWDWITAMTRGSVAARQVQQSQAKQIAPRISVEMEIPSEPQTRLGQ
ncbi:MAG: hypothetical protein HYX75_05645 [Acidobacteria bacterium]|nr:hypothetical protein [Acidobacteriota bacterium]